MWWMIDYLSEVDTETVLCVAWLEFVLVDEFLGMMIVIILHVEEGDFFVEAQLIDEEEEVSSEYTPALHFLYEVLQHAVGYRYAIEGGRASA